MNGAKLIWAEERDDLRVEETIQRRRVQKGNESRRDEAGFPLEKRDEAPEREGGGGYKKKLVSVAF